MSWLQAATGAIGLAGDIYGSQAQGAALNKQIQERKERERRRRADIGQLRQKGKEILTEGEKQFLDEYEAAPEEIEAARRDIVSGGTEAQQQQQAQIQAGLVQSGIRGGQAARTMARASGELSRDLQRDLNRIILEEALQRRKAKGAYFGTKAAGGIDRMFIAPGEA